MTVTTPRVELLCVGGELVNLFSLISDIRQQRKLQITVSDENKNVHHYIAMIVQICQLGSFYSSSFINWLSESKIIITI